ncbi:hypothetical protein D3C74_293230 [compost metagenome]
MTPSGNSFTTVSTPSMGRCKVMTSAVSSKLYCNCCDGIGFSRRLFTSSSIRVRSALTSTRCCPFSVVFFWMLNRSGFAGLVDMDGEPLLLPPDEPGWPGFEPPSPVEVRMICTESLLVFRSSTYTSTCTKLIPVVKGTLTVKVPVCDMEAASPFTLTEGVPGPSTSMVPSSRYWLSLVSRSSSSIRPLNTAART